MSELLRINQEAEEDETRELGQRSGDGLDIVLLWRKNIGAIVVSVSDARSGENFEIPVPPEKALDAFEHPFAYAPNFTQAA
jgi:hypothetical protein